MEETPKNNIEASPPQEGFLLPEGYIKLGEFELFSEERKYLPDTHLQLKSLTDSYYPEDIYQWVTSDMRWLFFAVRLGAKLKAKRRGLPDFRRGLGTSVILEEFKE